MRLELTELFKAHEAAKRELDEVKAVEGPLCAEMDSLTNDLSGMSPSALLMGRSNDDGKLDSATDLKLRKLKAVRTKLELFPGIRAKCERRLQESDHAIFKAVVEDVAKAIETARKNRAALEEMETERAKKTCGGDLARVKVVVETIIKNCDLSRWVDHLLYLKQDLARDPAGKVKHVLAEVARFNAGKSYPEA